MGGVRNVILQPFFAEKNYILFGKWSSSQWHLVEFVDTNFVLQFVFLKAKSTFVARSSLSFWLVTCNFRKRRLYGYLSQIGIMFRQFDLALRKNVMPWFLCHDKSENATENWKEVYILKVHNFSIFWLSLDPKMSQKYKIETYVYKKGTEQDF